MDKQKTTGDTLIDRICETIAKYEPFTLNDVVDTYLEVESIDKVLEIIFAAKRQNSQLSNVKREVGRDPTDVQREEVSGVNNEVKENWLKKRQTGIGVRDVKLKFGRE